MTEKRDGGTVWADIMNAELDRHHIPIHVEEERPMSDDANRQQDFYIKELQIEVANLTGTLFGREGNNGRLGGIESAIGKQTAAINKLSKQYAEHMIEHREHMREVEKTISAHEASAGIRFDRIERDVNALGEKGRGHAEAIDMLMKASSTKVTWWKQLGTHVLKMLAAAAALAIIGGMGAWVVSLL